MLFYDAFEDSGSCIERNVNKYGVGRAIPRVITHRVIALFLKELVDFLRELRLLNVCNTQP